jgi:hypothetical protein
MANLKIHEYPIERLTFGDNDYYDVDYYDGVNYLTAKIKGSVIRQGVINTLPTIYQPPTIDLSTAHLSGGVNHNPNAGAGYHLHINGTGSPARLDFNIPLQNLGIGYDGGTLDIKLAYQIYNTNSGGNVSFTIYYKFVKSDGTSNAETGASTLNTLVPVAGRSVNTLYEDLIASVSGPVNSDYLVLTIIRNTGNPNNTDLIDAIGIKLEK